jgi:hypothetical protein
MARFTRNLLAPALVALLAGCCLLLAGSDNKAAPGNGVIGLRWERLEKAVLLKWKGDTDLARHAQNATLSITGGPQEFITDLSLSILWRGSFPIAPNAKELNVRLEVVAADGKRFEEHVRIPPNGKP